MTEVTEDLKVHEVEEELGIHGVKLDQREVCGCTAWYLGTGVFQDRGPADWYLFSLDEGYSVVGVGRVRNSDRNGDFVQKLFPWMEKSPIMNAAIEAGIVFRRLKSSVA